MIIHSEICKLNCCSNNFAYIYFQHENNLFCKHFIKKQGPERGI